MPLFHRPQAAFVHIAEHITRIAWYGYMQPIALAVSRVFGHHRAVVQLFLYRRARIRTVPEVDKALGRLNGKRVAQADLALMDIARYGAAAIAGIPP